MSFAPQPPFPDDPAVCRWCTGHKREIIPATAHLPAVMVCDAGCAPNGSAPYTGYCDQCRRDFKTGHHHPSLCYECDQKERAAVNPEPAEYQTYNYSRIKRGGYRD